MGLNVSRDDVSPLLVRHPLDNEDITITVSVKHEPTGLEAKHSVHCPSDASPAVREGLWETGNAALDSLLIMLETMGGN